VRRGSTKCNADQLSAQLVNRVGDDRRRKRTRSWLPSDDRSDRVSFAEHGLRSRQACSSAEQVGRSWRFRRLAERRPIWLVVQARWNGCPAVRPACARIRSPSGSTRGPRPHGTDRSSADHAWPRRTAMPATGPSAEESKPACRTRYPPKCVPTTCAACPGSPRDSLQLQSADLVTDSGTTVATKSLDHEVFPEVPLRLARRIGPVPRRSAC
jgi:hypothetical protein